MISIIGVVSASEDINVDDTVTTPIPSNENVYSENSDSNNVVLDSASKGNSFKDLDSIISASNEVNLTQDYVFNEETDSDYLNGISINNRENLVINGNNHTINANNIAKIFYIKSSNVVFNDIVFKNSNVEAVYMDDSIINTYNNVFVNDLNNSRALSVENSKLSSNNDCFIDNYNNFGSSIILEGSVLNLVNATFKNKYDLGWALIYAEDKSYVTVINTTFTDITSKYASAIYLNSAEGTVINSTFKNLDANLTGGAIGVKNVDGNVLIVNSSFINVSSVKNGGAMFVDVDQNGTLGNIFLENCLFEDCYSLIGGAYLQLGGKLYVVNTTFRNNLAYIEGGAIYTSYTELNVLNSTFENNGITSEDAYYSSGGALYLDKTDLLIKNSTFTGNYANNGEDIFLYECDYEIEGSYFEDDIYSLYDEDALLENNTFKKENKFNDSFNPYVYIGPGGSIEYDPVILNESLINNSYFNLADYGLITKVKDQGDMGACWAFGTVGSLESAFLKATNRKLVLDISENNVQNLGLKYSPYGNKLFDEGGLRTIGTSYFLSWLGVTNVEDDSYDELGKLSPVMDSGNKYFIYDVVYIQPRQNMTDNLKLKEALIKYGALGISVHGAAGAKQKDYNEKTASAYFNSTFGNGTDHSVTLVGWNDSFSKENFLITPPGDGAWIIKNSWGSNWGDNGYYYVSYYDTAVATSKIIIAFTLNNSYSFERNYEYDITAIPEFYSDLTKGAYGNKFTALDNELITGIGTYFDNSDVNYEIIVYVDDEEVYRQNGTSSHYGYETIKLEQAVGVRENHTFLIKVVSNSIPLSYHSRQHYEKNTSFVYEGDIVQDISESNIVVCLKAYTNTDNSQINTSNLTTKYGSGEYINVTYYDENGELLTNQNVQFIINNKTYNRTTDDNGMAILDVNFEPGTYVVTIVNPVSLEKTNITLTILEIPSNNTVPTKNIIKHTPVQITKKVNYPTSYKIYKNDKFVTQSNTITINTLNMIFNQSFINGHLVVYLDGVVVFNDTVTDNIYRIILEITSKLLGQHELKVEFTDNNNQTHTYTENITIEL